MRWSKRGQIFCARGQAGWMHTHAQIPTVLVGDDRLRIYFATRPRPNLSLTTFLDVAREDPGHILYLHDRPVLEPGPSGTFDEHGIMPSCACWVDDEVWLYYGGWSRRASVPYSNWTGLAISTDGGTSFRKAFEGPIIDRTPNELYSATGCFVYREATRWHAWYASGTEWIDVDGSLEEVYRVKHATSRDGIRWERDGRDLLPASRRHEPTHRPTVVRIDDRYHMWFCHRDVRDFRDGAGSYRLGYAISDDLTSWHRDDAHATLPVSSDGWDSTMIAYPFVVKNGDDYLLFYNGNGFGASGFGYASLDRSAQPDTAQPDTAQPDTAQPDPKGASRR
jgi:predicted GH43/DUF377 family glycosyl hydrolase